MVDVKRVGEYDPYKLGGFVCSTVPIPRVLLLGSYGKVRVSVIRWVVEGWEAYGTRTCAGPGVGNL